MTKGYEYNKRWRNNHRDTYNDGKNRYYAKTAHLTVGYHRWSQEEIKAIMAPDKPTDTVLANQLGRSVKAIQVKRSNLGGM